VLTRFARHYRTGEAMPDTLLTKLREANNFRSGFNMVELIACALLDQAAHLHADDEADVRKIEHDVLEMLDMPSQIALRHRLPHFAHLFSSEGYAAGYYSYIWADVLTADCADAFADAPGGFYDQEVAWRFLDEILSVGNSIDPGEAYRRFRGRDASLRPLLLSRGLA
jgi:peptidyl-dipeptidase Dcp